ncbi:MAG TPA: hypothetical protein DD420_20910 [Streptomyces sp.]|nr:hypothetical protein [Streptomyces sp.]
MGWTVLYIAFGIVALWLLGEVLLQYKARLRWRLLAFAGFLGVVLGVLIPSVLVIVVGAIAFATGQTYVTLSFRRGFSTGWAIGGKPGASRRRRRGSQGPADSRPTLEVSDLEYQGQDQDQAPEAAAETAAFAVYEPQPLPDDTGQYGVYTDAGPSAGDAPAAPGQERYDAYDPYGGQGQDVFGGRSDYPAQETYQGQGTYTGPYDYTTGQPTGQQEYAAYTDPYAGNGGAGSAGDHAPYDGYGAGTPGDENGYGGGYDRQPDPYAGQYTTDTPPGGVWVPQQRENEYPPLPPEAPAAPYGNGYDTGQNDQYRY